MRIGILGSGLMGKSASTRCWSASAARADDAGDPFDASWRVRGTRRRPTRSRAHGEQLFYAHVHLHGGPAPVRRFLPGRIDLVWNGKINPGKVFDLILPLDQVAEGYRAMDERNASKTLCARKSAWCGCLQRGRSWPDQVSRRTHNGDMVETRTAQDR
jgi:hypothetical protein